MLRIFGFLLVLMVCGSVVLIVSDYSDGNGLRIARNLIYVATTSAMVFVIAPLGLLLLGQIYGPHYLVLGLMSLVAMVFGVVRSKKLHGQVIAVVGVLSWMFLGIYGLGHGG